MSFDSLSAQNIFAIPIGNHFGIPEQDLYLLYAPLNGRISLGTKDSIEELEQYASLPTDNSTLEHVLSSFQAKGSVPVYYLPHSAHELCQIDLLLNYTCNFKCVYCYSAAGRSQQQVSFKHIQTLMDYLFLSGRKQKSPYIINFSGGGEPLLSFDLIKKTVSYIRQINPADTYKYNIGLVTNGSLITPEIVDFLKENDIDMAVSFEILKRLQDKERGSYDRVAANLQMMCDKDYSFGIRTTFTPESVVCMCEMIEEVASKFPKMKTVVFDTVLAPVLFPTPKDLDDYYNTFIEEFYKAKTLAKEKGINLESNAVELLSMARERTCEGKMVLTPMGTISSCSRVSSPKEALYDDYRIGDTASGEVTLDNERYRGILSEYNIQTQAVCKHCFAKWNCGGGCRLFHQSFPEAYEEVRCNFTRNALKRQLLNVLSNNIRRSTGKELYDFIREKLAQ